MSVLPPYLVIDDFLPPQLHDALLAHALHSEDLFDRSTVRQAGAAAYAESTRKSRTTKELGDLKPALREAIRGVLPIMFRKLGMATLEPARIELQLSAHGDGDFFRPHVDTFRGRNRDGLETDRVITAVYYFHAQPRGFSGGAFAIHPLGGGEPVAIEPVDNRLLAIPAFALHEVRETSCPGGAFAASRFAVTAWVHRARSKRA